MEISVSDIYLFICYYYSLQEVNDMIKLKEELHKLKKEYDDLKLDMIQVYLLDLSFRFHSYLLD